MSLLEELYNFEDYYEMYHIEGHMNKFMSPK